MVRRVLVPLLVVFALIALAVGTTAAQPVVVRYVGGGETGFGVVGACLAKGHEVTIGQTCFYPCTDGDAHITVTDDINGEDIRFSVQVDNEPFFRGNAYWHEATIECNKIRVAPDTWFATTGIIEIA